MPSTSRTNCITTTQDGSAPMSAAIIGMSLMPPGVQHISEVMMSMLLVLYTSTPAAMLTTSRHGSRMSAGLRMVRISRTSSRLMPEPMKAPAMICAAVLASGGIYAPPVAT